MKRLVITHTLLVVVGVALCCGPAQAAWLADNFDSYSSDSLAGQGGWTGSSAVEVETTFVQSGKSVQADYLVWGAGGVSHSVPGTATYYYVDLDAAMDTAGGNKGENVGYIKLFNSSDVEITRLYYSEQQFRVLLGPSSPTVIKDNVSMRTWYHIRLGVNPSTDRMDVWVDGVRVVTNGQVDGTPSAISSIAFAQWDGLGGKFTKSETYMDNLVCDAGAPPDPPCLKIISPMEPWENWEAFNVFYPFVIHDSGAGDYKMYYSGSGAAQINNSLWDLWETGIATSPDMLTWSKPSDNYEPVLYARKFWEGDVVDPAEQSGIFDSIFAFGVCVIKDDATYKMWYTGWNGDSEHVGGGVTRKINYRIGYATSTNGLDWTKQSGGAGAGSVFGLGPPGSQDAKGVGQPYVVEDGSAYRMWYEGFDGTVWRIFCATSADRVAWTRQGLAIGTGGAGSADELGARNPVVIARGGHYELWYQGRSGAAPNHHVLRATSPDLTTWTKAGEVTLHPDDTLDGSEDIHVDSIIVKPDGSCQVYFAKQNTITKTLTFGSIQDRKSYIYTEAVDP